MVVVAVRADPEPSRGPCFQHRERAPATSYAHGINRLVRTDTFKFKGRIVRIGFPEVVIFFPLVVEFPVAARESRTKTASSHAPASLLVEFERCRLATPEFFKRLLGQLFERPLRPLKGLGPTLLVRHFLDQDGGKGILVFVWKPRGLFQNLLQELRHGKIISWRGAGVRKMCLPETRCDPRDSHYLFERFVEMIKNAR